MQCIPLRDLKDTTKLSATVKQSHNPIVITKNGYTDMYIMSAEVFDRIRLHSIFERMMEAEADIAEGKVSDAHASLQGLREKYGL